MSGLAERVLAAARAEISPLVAEWEAGETSLETMREFSRRLGLTALRTPEHRGGSPRPWTEITGAARSLGRIYRLFGLVLVNNVIAAFLGEQGSDRQWERWGAPIHRGEMLLALALTERGAGNDLGSITTSVSEEGGGLILRGGKVFAPAANRLRALVTLAVHGEGTSVLAVPTDAAGVSVRPMGAGMSLRGAQVCEVTFDDCRLGAEHLIGSPGRGLEQLRPHLLGSRLNTAGLALGAAEEALDLAVAHTAATVRFGKPLNRLGAVRRRLGDLAIRTGAARALLDAAAAALDEGRPQVETLVSAAKAFVTESAAEVTDGAWELFGGWGFFEEKTVERLVREAKLGLVVDGANDIHRDIVARNLGSGKPVGNPAGHPIENPVEGGVK